MYIKEQLLRNIVSQLILEQETKNLQNIYRFIEPGEGMTNFADQYYYRKNNRGEWEASKDYDEKSGEGKFYNLQKNPKYKSSVDKLKLAFDNQSDPNKLRLLSLSKIRGLRLQYSDNVTDDPQESQIEDNETSKNKEESSDQVKGKSSNQTSTVKNTDKDITVKNWSDIKLADWTSTKTDFIDSINFKGQIYISYGYGTTNTGKDGLAVLMPHDIFRSLWNESAKGEVTLIERGSTFKTIKPKKGNFDLKSKKPNVHVLIKWGTKNITLNVSTIELAPGAAMANKISEVLNVAGAVPVIGSIADAANVITQLKMSPPSMFGALCSLIGAIPAFGDAVVMWKVSSRIGDISSGLKAGKTLSKVVSEVLGTPTLRAALKGKGIIKRLIEAKDSILGFIKKQIEPLKNYIPDIDVIIRNFEAYVDKAIEAYKYYKNLPPVQIMTSIKQWQSLLLRPVASVSKIITNDLNISLLEASGIYKSLGIESSGNLNSDLDRVIRELSTIKSIEDLNEANLKAFKVLTDVLLTVQEKTNIDFGLIN